MPGNPEGGPNMNPEQEDVHNQATKREGEEPKSRAKDPTKAEYMARAESVAEHMEASIASRKVGLEDVANKQREKADTKAKEAGKNYEKAKVEAKKVLGMVINDVAEGNNSQLNFEHLSMSGEKNVMYCELANRMIDAVFETSDNYSDYRIPDRISDNMKRLPVVMPADFGGGAEITKTYDLHELREKNLINDQDDLDGNPNDALTPLTIEIVSQSK